ncbi:type IV toxin-antitoxin system AbiEi family antitoxin [Solitalea lacus]|uniref:type IV toxin-antitoxin system AbiEi family antitoxin n=1 Tax=Solitalea lacus TaxID=2911172 RepID=UPI001EDAA038|nr:type IV toxin-antitoxin system AbiEi family antitoxin [Solitalea lacus]UKJ07282.1 hypothetical protein L2B55_17375 [Solitalea lacus]
MNKKIALLEDVIVERALSHLEDLAGIKGMWKPMRQPQDKGIDGEITMNLGMDTLIFHAEVRRELREYQLSQILNLANQYAPFMLVANHIFPTIKEQLRKNGIAYLDGGGNLFLRHHTHFVWLEGNKPPKEEKPTPNRAFTKTGLKVIYVLLTQEDAIQLPFREIAERANVALGNIPLVLAGLKEAGHLLQMDKKKVILQNKKELLERWIAGYRETLRPTLHLGNYQLLDKKANWQNLHFDGAEWGGEPAANLLTSYLNPEILIIYTKEQKNKLMKSWKLIPHSKGNVQLYQKFWNEEKASNLPIAPQLIIYADLLLTDDPRCIEVAEIIYNKYLKQLFE